jgi:hypothetical protein
MLDNKCPALKFGFHKSKKDNNKNMKLKSYDCVGTKKTRTEDAIVGDNKQTPSKKKKKKKREKEEGVI